MNLKEFDVTISGVKYLIFVEYNGADDYILAGKLLSSPGIIDISSPTLFGCDNPVDATIAVKNLKDRGSISNIDLIRVTDIMDLNRCFN